jgi:ABC-type Fe3+/spermidine/putrescine transport system ATPase subunit
MTTAIELNGLTKTYGDLLAVDAVSAVVLPG